VPRSLPPYPSLILTATIGRFLLGLLTDLLKWHQDEQQYLQDNRVKGAGKAAYLPGLQLRWTSKPTVAISDLAKWSEVQQFNRKCHRKLAKVCVPPLPLDSAQFDWNPYRRLSLTVSIPESSCTSTTPSSY